MTATRDYRGKKVLILGLGQYPQGSGAAATRYFARHGAKVTVTDRKSRTELAAAVRRLKGFRVKFELGGHRLADVDAADLVVRNPGVPREAPELRRARARRIAVTTDIIEFLERCPAPVVGVTGTRGKSTTTALIAAMLRRSGFKAWLGGNIKVSPLTFVDRVRPTDRVVLELSSWMLEDLPARRLSPAVAVMTNLLRDHLNTYASMAEYGRAKAGIFASQAADGVAVLSRDNVWTRRIGRAVSGRRIWTSTRPVKEENAVFVRGGEIILRERGREIAVVKTGSLALRGEHNLENALAAVAAARAAGAALAAIRGALRTFKGLPDRLEEVRRLRGVVLVNDTTATTPDATMAALRTLDHGRLTLIVGGTDKKLEFSELAREIRRRRPELVLLPGTATDKLKLALRRAGWHRGYTEAGSMRQAVAVAYRLAAPRGTVLLSPGAASFGLFRNEFDRGEKFVAAVKKLG